MIKLEKVNKYFYRHKKNQIHVINNTNLEFENAGLVALLGPSGCGKTTLLNAIGGLDKVNSGKIYINDKIITKRRSYYVDKIRNINIGYIFQDYNLIDNLSVFDNVALSLKINGIKNKDEIKKRVNYVLEKVDMYRYRNRYASMLSGGERQRVGIARAIVKDPSIIIADEPTGNLDSKNSLEVMNIIKAISKDRLVILVTHETDLAEFYASRIIDIKDGEIVNDRINDHTNDLDYRLDNKIYLKDLKNHYSLSNKNVNIDYYSNDKNKLDIDIVIQNGNIYIKTKSNEKLEIVDDDSSIEFEDSHYKKISKTIYEEYNFDFDQIINKNIKKRYSSIFNPITLLINGFRKVRDYSFSKKLLLIGFFVTGLFIMNLFSNILGVTNIKDSDFVTVNKNYLEIIIDKINVDDYFSYKRNELVDYILPGNSKVSLTLKVNDYYQTSNFSTNVSGSLSSLSLINEEDLILGTFPTNSHEIVLDISVIKKVFDNSSIKEAGVLKNEDFIGRKLNVNNMNDFIIVGIVDKGDPSIYTNENEFINILYNSNPSDMEYSSSSEMNSNLIDYSLVQDKIVLKGGRYPYNDYEVIIRNELKDEYKLNKPLNIKVNGINLIVVGYYSSSSIKDKYLVCGSTVSYDLISKSSNITIYSKEKETALNYFKESGLNAVDTYNNDKAEYKKGIKDFVITCLVVCLVTLLISLIEIYLMIRSSFLSRIKEVGIYRAIGMKKRDIKKMFLGEIIAITTLASLPGVILMSYIVKQLTTMSYFEKNYLINYKIILIIIVFIYIFNIFVGLIPVKRVLRQTPAKILSRSDLE